MNKIALTRLAQLLRKPLPKGVDRFDMTYWRAEQACGTTVCACGLAATDPWFRKRGFVEFPSGFPSVSEWFNIELGEAYRLFDRGSYKRGNRLDVARRIEGFVKSGKTVPQKTSFQPTRE